MTVAATIGHFDGVHLGHRHVIDCLRKAAAERGIGELMVVTFDRHPRTLFDPSFVPQMLTTLEERFTLLRECGIDRCEVLQFDREMAAMTAYDFMKTILRDKLGVRLLVLGYDNRFGRRLPGEGLSDYVCYGEELGIEVIGCDEYLTPDGHHVSSSIIRQLLADGDKELAHKLRGSTRTPRKA